MPLAKPPVLPLAATTRPQPTWHEASPRMVRRCSYGATASSWWLPSRHARRYCLVSPSRRKRWPRWNRDDRGSASLVAVAMMAVLLAITTGAVYVGSAVIVRHRAQASADLAALGAAARLADGAEQACARASAMARTMRTAVIECTVDGLDVVITVDAHVSLGRMGVGSARAAARAGPIVTDG
jgi:secretion/DNA translocation related TadE-like protein